MESKSGPDFYDDTESVIKDLNWFFNKGVDLRYLIFWDSMQ